MKKLITVLSAVILVSCIAVLFSGCGAKDEEIITSTETTGTTISTTMTTTMKNDGMVTDESIEGENGLIGDIVTDISEGISDMVTDISEDASEIMQ